LRWLQVLAVVSACISLVVVPLLGSMVLRSSLVILLVIHGAVSVLAASALLLHYRFGLQLVFGLSLLTAIAGVAGIFAFPVPSGMMSTVFQLIRGIAVLLCLPSIGSVLMCLLSRELRLVLFRLP